MRTQTNSINKNFSILFPWVPTIEEINKNLIRVIRIFKWYLTRFNTWLSVYHPTLTLILILIDIVLILDHFIHLL